MKALKIYLLFFATALFSCGEKEGEYLSVNIGALPQVNPRLDCILNEGIENVLLRSVDPGRDKQSLILTTPRTIIVSFNFIYSDTTFLSFDGYIPGPAQQFDPQNLKDIPLGTDQFSLASYYITSSSKNAVLNFLVSSQGFLSFSNVETEFGGVLDVSLNNTERIWLLSNQDTALQLHRYTAQGFELDQRFEGYNNGMVDFGEQNFGYFLMEHDGNIENSPIPANIIYLSKSGNQGDDWSTPKAVPALTGEALYKLHIVNQATFVVQTQSGSFYQTLDYGETFTKLQYDNPAESKEPTIYFPEPGVWAVFYEEAPGSPENDTHLDIYVEGVKTTIDNVFIDNPKASFIDRNNFVIYSVDQLFLTRDGGNSWEILAYPFDYVNTPFNCY